VEVESFEQARRLDRAGLDALLASERPEQRLWAVWALALSLGEKTGELVMRIDREPDAGVRRSLAVILASHGEHDLLIDLARHDRSRFVRESAIALVTRIAAAGGPREPKLRALVEEAARGEPAIQIAVLGAIVKDAPAYLLDIAFRLLDAKDAEVQLEAFETLLRVDTQRSHEAARAWFRSKPDPSHYVERWLRGADMLALADAVHDLPMQLRGNVLARLRSPPWLVVEALIGDDFELLRATLARPDVTIPSTTLARAILRGAHDGFVARLGRQLTIASHGHAVLDELRAAIADADPADLTLVRSLIARAKEFADAIEIPDRDEVLGELADAHPVETLLGLENAIARWAASHVAPAELFPLLPGLERHCAQQLAMFERRADLRRQQLALGDGHDVPRPRDERALHEDFRQLSGALERLTART
jgi:hypothetical protein